MNNLKLNWKNTIYNSVPKYSGVNLIKYVQDMNTENYQTNDEWVMLIG